MFKVRLLKKVSKIFLLCTRSLLKTIYTFVKYIAMIWILIINKSWWLFNINYLFKFSIEKCRLYVHLKNSNIRVSSICKENVNRLQSCNWRKCMFVVNSFLLAIPFYYETCFVLQKITFFV